MTKQKLESPFVFLEFVEFRLIMDAYN